MNKKMQLHQKDYLSIKQAILDAILYLQIEIKENERSESKYAAEIINKNQAKVKEYKDLLEVLDIG